MRDGHRANALLVELLLVILFFMLGSTTLVEIFADAKHKSLQARAMNAAVMEAENISDDLYGADDPEKVLADLGFTKENDSWILTEKEYTLTVTQKDEETENGVLRIFTIDGRGDGKDLFSLPSTRYIPKEVSP
jgi:hypothetical protein